jgi:Dyp-type peroxidase family
VIARLRVRLQRPDLDAIQGNVLQGYRYAHARYVLLGFDRADAARRWLRVQAEDVTSAARWDAKPPFARNLALSAPGLAALGVAGPLLDTFAQEFREGMRARARVVLGDAGPSDPDRWEAPWREGDPPVHALLSVHGDDPAVLDELVADAPAPGVRVLHVERAATLGATPDGDVREHFGYTDGFSQPSFRGVRYVTRQPRGNGVPLRFGRWRRMALGELVLGYVDEDRVLPEMPGGALGANGTYLVYRKLAQDVGAFRAWTLGAAEGDEGAADLLRARIVGRWPDGTPLAVRPDGPDRAVSQDPEARSRVRYGDDPDGLNCPLGAHVRRANPRDGLPYGHKQTFRQRIVRRGMPYGPPYGPGTEDAERGLVFIALNANLSRQFEVVQGSWLSDGRIFGLGRDRDPLTGGPQEDGKLVIQTSRPQPPRILAPLPAFVTTRGGGYFFVPSRPALRALGEGTEGSG